MSNGFVIGLIAVLAVITIAGIVARSRRANDGVDSFRRQIDALSPEARRPVIDQVQNAAGRNPRDPDTDTDPETDSDPEDGPRGT